MENLTEAHEDYSNLSREEILRIKRRKHLEKHKGHETMHMEIFIILFVVFFVSQMALIYWRKKHVKSYDICTLIGMWIIPLIFGLHLGWNRFLFTWALYTIMTAIITAQARKKPLSGKTPSLVYGWFLFMFRLSCAVGIIGYACFICTFVGFNMLFLISPEKALDFSITVLGYGLYYGVMSRDFAEICSEIMASTIGYYTTTGMPTKDLAEGVCAICGNSVVNLEPESSPEKVFRLSCGHQFHEFCIRGWCIVGKKQTCPYCKEKVDLKRMFPSPWERPQMLYGQMLDWIRYLVAWQPLIITIVQVINWSLGLK